MNTSIKKLGISILLPACVALTAMAPGAAHADRKTMHASACRFTNSDVPWAIEVNTLVNMSRDTQTLLCPLVRDATGGLITDLDVFVEDGSSSEGVQCSLSIENEHATGLAADPVKTSNSFKGWKRIDLDPKNLNMDQITQHSYYMLDCKLPGTRGGNSPSGITAYSWNE